MSDVEQLRRMAEEAAARLGEHASAVQILISLPAPGGGTVSIKKGVGDWYARQGLAHEFIMADQAQEIAHAIHDSTQ